MKKLLLSAIPALALTLASLPSTAQQHIHVTDPFDQIFERAAQSNPNFETDMAAFQQELAAKAAVYIQAPGMQAAGKTTTTTNRTIPVIFHVVLDTAKMSVMGGTAGIIERIQSQLAVLNEDFNAANADSVDIPAPFKPMYTNMDIKFGLAHTAPDGSYTPGYEFVSTTKLGYDIQGGTMGSTYYCSDAKYTAAGGADGWDPQKYLNIWIINITPFGVGGIGTPPPYAMYGGTAMFPWAEQGITLSYAVLGRQTSSSQYFIAPSAIMGRALVHEAGHFFNLFHTFGMSTMNNSNCQDDDGVTDTPPQVAPTQAAPIFPIVDACSPNAPGIMYMNHMDYTADTTRTMFTPGQKARVYVEADTNGFRHSLFLHPELLENGTTDVAGVPAERAHFNIYPNPATSFATFSFGSGDKLQHITVINQFGQKVADVVPQSNVWEYRIDISQFSKGIYFVQAKFEHSQVTEKLIVY